MSNSKKQNKSPIKQKSKQNVPTVQQQTLTQVKSSPIPSPEDLIAHQIIDAELVNRIITMAMFFLVNSLSNEASGTHRAVV